MTYPDLIKWDTHMFIKPSPVPPHTKKHILEIATDVNDSWLLSPNDITIHMFLRDLWYINEPSGIKRRCLFRRESFAKKVCGTSRRPYLCKRAGTRMNEDLELFDPFRYFTPRLRSIILREEEKPMLRTYNYLFNLETNNYRIIFRDGCDKAGSWFVDTAIPPFGEDHEDTVSLIVDALNAKAHAAYH